MRFRFAAAAALAGLPLSVLACEAEPNRSYYDDVLDSGVATTPVDATASEESSPDAPLGDDASGDDAKANGDAAAEAGGSVSDADGDAAALTGGASDGSSDANGAGDAAGAGDASSDASEGGAGPDALCTNVEVPPAVNVDANQWSFAGAPAWACTAAGTTTISSTGSTSACPAVTGDTCGGSATLDCTNSVAQTSAGGPSVMVVRLSGLTVTNGHVIELVGDKPIVFLVAGDVIVDSGGQIDASAAGTRAGPGGSIAASCGTSTGGSGQTSSQKSSGGGGGGFGTAGGAGGGGGTVPAGGAAGAAGGAASLQPLTGGCSGGPGGSIGGTGTGGAGGAGGGAFEISASGTIAIGTGSNAAVLSAAGDGSPAPAPGGTANNLGYYDNASGGAGSGGAILLVSPATAAFGTGGIARVHGGGSAGSFANNSTSGTPTAGTNGHTADDTPAAGGNGGGSGTFDTGGVAGGLYSATSAGVVATANGATGSAAYASSGGGGGGGRVQVTTGAATLVCE
jgi:hypothetical protein